MSLWSPRRHVATTIGPSSQERVIVIAMPMSYLQHHITIILVGVNRAVASHALRRLIAFTITCCVYHVVLLTGANANVTTTLHDNNNGFVIFIDAVIVMSPIALPRRAPIGRHAISQAHANAIAALPQMNAYSVTHRCYTIHSIVTNKYQRRHH